MRQFCTRRIGRLSALLIGGFLLLTLAACGEDDNGPQAGETVILEAGSASDGPFGTKFRAQSNSISEPLDIGVAQVEAPTDDVPLPDGVQTRGMAYELTPERDVVTEPDEPFLVGLPIPEDANVEDVAVAVQIQPYEYEVAWDDEGRPEDYEPGREWSFQEAYIAQGTVATTLPRLYADDPRLLTVVEAPSFESFDGSETQPMSHSDENFDAVCTGGFGGAPESCNSSVRQSARDALRDVFHDLTDMGFNEPALSRRVNVVPNLFNSDVAFGPWLMRLRPCSEVKYGGLYKHGTDRAWTCVDSGGWGDGDEGNTLRHEFFHGTQYGYGPMREGIRQRHEFIIEGQAVASETSATSLTRDSRGLRELDVTMLTNSDDLSSGDLVEYRAQDFWVFLAEYFGESDVGFFAEFLERGNRADDVDRTLDEEFDTGLAQVYFEWAKNQAFESQYASLNSDLNGACVFEPDSVNNTEKVTFTENSGLSQDSITLDPMTSDVIEFDLQPASEPYLVTIALDSAQTLRDDFKVYRNHGSPTEECLDKANPTFEPVAVNPGEPVTVYALATNALRDDSMEVELSANVQEASLSIDITSPSDGASLPEGALVNFESDVTATEGVDEIEWVTENPDNYAGGGDVLGRGESASAGLLCPGDHTVTATLTDEFGLTDSDQVTFTVENQAPSMEFVTDPVPSSIGTGDYLILKAEATDRICEFGPGSNGADESLIEWTVAGFSAGSGNALTHKIVADAGETISVSAEYTDDGGETATLGPRELDVTTPPPGGYPPRVVIESYDSGDDIKTKTIFLEGSALDAEDGPLTGSDLEWTVTDRNGNSVTRTGEDATIPDGDAAGLHRGSLDIELRATDSDGNTNTTDVSVNFVGPG